MVNVLAGVGAVGGPRMRAVAYEVALEGAGQAIGLYAELIATEEVAGAPDGAAIARWRAEQRAWAARRRALTPQDGQEIDAIYSEGEILLAEADEAAEEDRGSHTPGERLLDEVESERIFRERIAPDELTGAPQEHPVVVIVAGQPGDGKAMVTALAQGVLIRHDRHPVTISPDRYQPHWPGFRTPLDDEPTPAGYLSTDSRRWTAKALAYAAPTASTS